MWQNRSVLNWDCDVFVPESTSGDPLFGLLYLHDEDGTNRLRASAEHVLQAHNLVAIVPHCGPCWWMDKLVPSFDASITPQEFLADHVAGLMETEFGIGAQRLGLLGVGMGGQGALKLSYAKPSVFPVVAAISPSIDFHNLLREGHPVLSEVFQDVEAARQYTPILHVHPLNWPRFEFFCCDPEDYQWYDSADRLRMKLGSIGIAHDADLDTSCEGDRDAYCEQMIPVAIDYVATKLDETRRSLI